MNAQQSLKFFSDRYNEEMISSIESLSNELGVQYHKCRIVGANLSESVNEFKDFITNYVKYKKENINNVDASPQKAIYESAINNISSELFSPADLFYKDFPSYIESYLTGIQEVDKLCDQGKQELMEAGVDIDSVGAIEEFASLFYRRLNESFYPVVDRMVNASGYTARQNLSFEAYCERKKQREANTFL